MAKAQGGMVMLALLAAASAVQAVEISNGAFAAVYVRDCRSWAAKAAGSTSADMCEASGDFSGTLVQQNWSNVLGGLSAGTASTNPLAVNGSLVSSSTVSVADGLTIKQAAFTGTPYARVSSQSFALQSYSWNGTGSAARSVTGSLDFTEYSPTSFDAQSNQPSGLVQGFVSVFSLATPSFNVNPISASQGDFEQFAKIRGDYRSEASQVVQTVSASPYTFNVSFTMQAGRTYFVESWLSLYGRFGGWVDATHTYKVNFDDTDGLTAAAALDAPVVVSSVPEPGSLVMLSVGLLLLAGLRRSARS